MAVRVFFPTAALAAAAIGCGSSESSPSPGIPGPIDAREDQALAFAGDDYANTGTAGFPFPESPHTISFFIHHDGAPGIGVAVAMRKDWDSGVAVGLREGLLGAWNVFGPRTLVEDSTPLTPGVWHHVAYVYDGGSHRLFTDGREVSSGVRDPTRRTPTTGWLGSVDGVRDFYRGKLDEVRIWTAARTLEQLAQEARGAASANDPNLVAYWTFDEVSGARAYDRSGRDNHAILGDGIEAHAPVRVPSAR
jgi:hypothetical protein